MTTSAAGGGTAQGYVASLVAWSVVLVLGMPLTLWWVISYSPHRGVREDNPG